VALRVQESEAVRFAWPVALSECAQDESDAGQRMKSETGGGFPVIAQNVRGEPEPFEKCCFVHWDSVHERENGPEMM
jgi:hypothetical protein